MRCPLLSKRLLVFRLFNYVLKLFTVALNVTVGIFMAVIPSTSLRCRLCLGHSVLNLNKRIYRLCSCGTKETEERLLLNCTFHSTFCVVFLQSVKLISMKEGLHGLCCQV